MKATSPSHETAQPAAPPIQGLAMEGTTPATVPTHAATNKRRSTASAAQLATRSRRAEDAAADTPAALSARSRGPEGLAASGASTETLASREVERAAAGVRTRGDCEWGLSVFVGLRSVGWGRAAVTVTADGSNASRTQHRIFKEILVKIYFLKICYERH